MGSAIDYKSTLNPWLSKYNISTHNISENTKQTRIILDICMVIHIHNLWKKTAKTFN